MSLFDHDIRVPRFDLIVQLPAVRAFPECRGIRGRVIFSRLPLGYVTGIAPVKYSFLHIDHK